MSANHARDYATYFTCINLFNHHNNALRWVLALSSPFIDKNMDRGVQQLTEGCTSGW